MTVRIAMNVVCDRCLKPFVGRNLEYGEEVPKIEREQLVLRRAKINKKTGEIQEKVVFDYEDLCKQCKSVVAKAIDRIKMTPAKKKPKTTAKKEPASTPPSEEKPPEPEPEPEPEKPAEPEPEPEPEKPAEPEPEDKTEVPPEEEEPLF